MNNEPLHADFVVIGSGVAGLRAAIELSPCGDVIVVTKDATRESTTEYAQGGVAVALSDEDEVGIHLEDTIRAGDGLCREEAVRVLVQEGPDRIRELIDWGAAFDRSGSKLSFTLEAAHSRRRVLHAHGDSTGRELERVLVHKVKTFSKVRRFKFSAAVDLLIEDGVCTGVIVMHERKLFSVRARATVIATGGAGQIFSRTTNPDVATGDGMAIAFRAGAILEDMEFVQFHPTVLFAPSAPQFLLSEAMRGEGAVLRNIHRELFMKLYHPAGELAPRDIVTRAIISEMVRTNSSYVYLDLSHLDPEFVKHRFPKIHATCLQYDISITKDLIPVSPAAHYIMGGIRTDTMGRTTVPGLFAAGEAACTGVHGANRLASNSLLEGLVFGFRAAQAAVEYRGSNLRNVPDTISPPNAEPCSGPAPEEREEIRTSLRRLMWERVGIIRCSLSLGEARETLAGWRHLMHDRCLCRRDLELKNMYTVSSLIAESAWHRKGSVGGHYRSDFREKGEDWKKHLTIRKNDDDFEMGTTD